MNNQNIQDSVFLLMTYESIKYILSKQIEKKEKKDEIEELGINFGEKATNHLMNNNVNEGNNNSKKITDYILIFITRNVWEYIFKDENRKLKSDKKGVYYINSGDLKLYNYLITNKDFQNDEILESIIWFISGILRGALLAFNIESLVTGSVKLWTNDDSDSKNKINESYLVFTFAINIVNFEFKYDSDFNQK
jgi:hypothetical protein